MTALDPSDALRVAQAAAEAAGRILLEGFGDPGLEASAKSHRHDPVTIYDRRAEEAILSVLSGHDPDHAVLAEESGRSGPPGAPTWVIDPLDGTNNFLRGIPHFSVSIALEIAGDRVAACVYDPIRQETFTAARGEGARLNDQPIRVSSHPTLEGAAIAVGLSHVPSRRAQSLAQLSGLIAAARALRTTGSAALDLAYVAAGRFDVAWYLALSPWDVAAGCLLVEEAGGRVSALDGQELVDPLRGLIASNGRFEAALRTALGNEDGAGEEHHD